MIRPEVNELLKLGSFPSSSAVVPEVIKAQEELLRNIGSPVTDDEARALIKLFGPDDYYGGAWMVLHLVESAPNWPLMDCLSNDTNEWVVRLKERSARTNDSTPANE
jgi:hypothetical protein